MDYIWLHIPRSNVLPLQTHAAITCPDYHWSLWTTTCMFQQQSITMVTCMFQQQSITMVTTLLSDHVAISPLELLLDRLNLLFCRPQEQTQTSAWLAMQYSLPYNCMTVCVYVYISNLQTYLYHQPGSQITIHKLRHYAIGVVRILIINGKGVAPVYKYVI